MLCAVTCLAYSNREEGSNCQLQNSILPLTCPILSKESYLLHVNENMAHNFDVILVSPTVLYVMAHSVVGWSALHQ